ncbi:MAG: carboxypeptidase-like regulatory domain-containing protein, partial [Bacteroidota bacterium]
TISPALVGFQVLASVQVGGATVSAYADEAGVFQINGVPAGTYDVTLTPDPLSGKAIKIVTGVVVVNGVVKDLGSIALNPAP